MSKKSWSPGSLIRTPIYPQIRTALGHCPNPECSDYGSDKILFRVNYCTSCGADLFGHWSNLNTPATAAMMHDWTEFEIADNSYFILIHVLIEKHKLTKTIEASKSSPPPPNATTKKLNLPSYLPISIKPSPAFSEACVICDMTIESCTCGQNYLYSEVIENILPVKYDSHLDMYEWYENYQGFRVDDISCFNCEHFMSAGCPQLNFSLRQLALSKTAAPIKPCDQYDPDISLLSYGMYGIHGIYG